MNKHYVSVINGEQKEKRLSIYAVGPHGNVGWVCSYSYRQDDHTKIKSIDLSLDMDKALVFSSDGVDPDALAIAKFLRVNSAKYGAAHCFAW